MLRVSHHQILFCSLMTNSTGFCITAFPELPNAEPRMHRLERRLNSCDHKCSGNALRLEETVMPGALHAAPVEGTVVPCKQPCSDSNHVAMATRIKSVQELCASWYRYGDMSASYQMQIHCNIQ